jgi:two-component system sensor histidine kinase ChvG
MTEPEAYNRSPARTRVLREHSALGMHIFGVNLLALIVLIVGIFYVSEHRENLIRAELELLRTEVELASAALTRAREGHNSLHAGKTRNITTRLNDILNHRVLVYSRDKNLVFEHGNLVQPDAQQSDRNGRARMPPTIDALFQYTVSLIPIEINLPLYKGLDEGDIANHDDARKAIDGKIAISAWKGDAGNIVLSAAAPVTYDGDVIGAVQLFKGDTEITAASAQARLNVMRIFIGALSVTVLISIYLSGVIGRPLRKLATAAEAVRLGYGRHTEIPDYSGRRDEIGELSLSLREMTQALWRRMDMIERFAVDVAHELKNPITSVRSATETAKRIDDADKRARLLDIITHDIARMDRLISDISSSSRLDTALMQEARARLNLVEVLRDVIAQYAAVKDRSAPGIDENAMRDGICDEIGRILRIGGDIQACYVLANRERLFQVFDNLISNALSFTPAKGEVVITMHLTRRQVEILIDDQGPGIPDDMLKRIFERFYTQRPDAQGFGSHSGLGLAIVKQIIDNLDGGIRAENRYDKSGAVCGARFVVTLSRID